MINKIKNRIRAFSLIELSIVILITSILITGALTVSKTSIRNANLKVTKDRMDAINKALANFLAANKRLPCPGTFTIVSGSANYGAEGTPAGTCTTTNGGIASTPTYTDLVWGMVPTVALGLPSDMASDGFGTRFSYVVDKRFTVATVNTSSTTGFEFTPGTPQGSVKVSPPDVTATTVSNQTFAIMTTGATGGNIINIRDGTTSGTVTTAIALYALISHGPNKLGGYNYSSTSQNSTSGAGAGETTNYYTAAFDNLFVNNATDSTSDDLVLYRTKLQLLYDAGLENVICSARESYYCPNTTQLTTATTCNTGNALMSYPSSVYGPTIINANSVTCTAPAGGTCDDRTCGKYGIWSIPSSTS